MSQKLIKGCVVYMNSKSGCVGYGNPQCISNVCEPLGEISLYGHNQSYKIHDIREVVSYPYSPSDNTQSIGTEFIVCSAIQYENKGGEEIWICGLRHNNCISTWHQTTGQQTHDEEQGFLTSKNRFVNRTEAGKIALACGQIKELKYYGGKKLDSSDLYHNVPTDNTQIRDGGYSREDIENAIEFGCRQHIKNGYINLEEKDKFIRSLK